MSLRGVLRNLFLERDWSYACHGINTNEKVLDTAMWKIGCSQTDNTGKLPAN